MEVAALRSLKRKPDSDGNNAVEAKSLDSKRLKKGSRANYSKAGFVGIDNGEGMVFFEVAVLAFMLVQIFHYDQRRAVKMCWAYGLDKRAQSMLRAKSCRTPKAPGHGSKGEFHDFPRGYSFSVEDKYAEYKRLFDNLPRNKQQDFR